MEEERIKRGEFNNNSYFSLANDFVITEIDKARFYNDILNEDECAVLDHDKKFVYFFGFGPATVLSEMLNQEFLGSKNRKSVEDNLTEEEIKEAFSKEKIRTLLFNRLCTVVIDTHWPKYRNITTDIGEIMVSVYPVERRVAFAINGYNNVEERDLLEIIGKSPKCLDLKEWTKRVQKCYRKEWEREFGSWEKFENKKPSYIS